MTETVVHVTTLEQWKSVLDVWFKQGYIWVDGDDTYNENDFCKYGSHQIGLTGYTKKYISCWVNNDYDGYNMIEFSEFMAQQKEDNKMATYYVTQEQLDLIEELKGEPAPLDWIIMDYDNSYRALRVDVTNEKSNAIMRYLGGDETIGFKVKEEFYRLWRIDEDNDKVYMMFKHGSPIVSLYKNNAFIAPLEEIKKWETPAWKIEEVN